MLVESVRLALAGKCLIVPGAALALSGALPVVVRPLLLRLGAFDTPNHRSSHEAPVLRGAGIAPALALVAAGAATRALVATPLDPGLVALPLVVLAAASLGFVEDVRGVSAGRRAAVQLAIGIAAAAALALTHASPWWTAPLGALCIAGYMNAANFMDGVDGMSSLHGAVSGVVFATAGLASARLWLVLAGLAVAAAYAAFLPWNLAGRRLFLGDTGSYALGAAISVVAILAVIDGLPLLAALAPLTIYVADTAFTLVRRVARGAPWHEPHREHVYQAHVLAGRSHLFAAVTTAAASATTGALGLTSLAGFLPSAAAAAGIVLTVTVYLLLPRLLTRTSNATKQAGAEAAGRRA